MRWTIGEQNTKWKQKQITEYIIAKIECNKNDELVSGDICFILLFLLTTCIEGQHWWYCVNLIWSIPRRWWYIVEP